MPVSTLEIIDTAIKIGLGAFIAGTFGFLNLQTKEKNEKSKEKRNETKSLIKKMTFKVDQSTTEFIKCAELCKHARSCDGDNIDSRAEYLKKAKTKELEAMKIIGEAETLAVFIGDGNIETLVEKCKVKTLEIGKELSDMSIEIDEKVKSKHLREYNDITKNLHDAIRVKYSKYRE